jgi:hypothetical protein
MITIPVILDRVTHETDHGPYTRWRASILTGAREYGSESEARAACEKQLADALAKCGESGIRYRYTVRETRIPFPKEW